MIPSAKIANWVSAPPENRLISVKALLFCVPALLRKACTALKSTPGTGRWDPRRYTAMIASVKRILPRRSGTLNALRKADSIRTDLLHDLDGAAGGGDLGGRRGRKSMRPDLQGDRQLAVPEDLHGGALAGQARLDQGVRVDATALGEGGGEPVEVHHRPGDLVRAVEAPQLGHAALERHLAALEADAHVAPGVGALGAPAGGLTLSRGLTAALADALGPGAGSGTQVMQLHSGTSSTFTRWETLNSMPRISGRSSCSTTSCIRFRPNDLMVARCGRGRPMSERTWVMRSLLMPAPPSRHGRSARRRPP